MRNTSTGADGGESPREHDRRVGTALSPETRLHIEKAVDVLVEEFGDHHAPDGRADHGRLRS
jgi:hypothetical protein